MEKIIEICCGSYYDAKQAYLGGAKRIELNSALHLGGLTPSIGTLRRVKSECRLNVICMVRPRGAGFCYTNEDYQVMLEDARLLMENGADGLAFGILDAQGKVDVERNKAIIDIIKEYNGTAVFHRAFDCVPDAFAAMDTLVELGVDRLLTSGQKAKAVEGRELIRQLQDRYGERIEILAGSGVNAANARELMDYTGIHQVHSSCKDWMRDETTSAADVDFAYAGEGHQDEYEVVSRELVEKIVAVVR